MTLAELKAKESRLRGLLADMPAWTPRAQELTLQIADVVQEIYQAQQPPEPQLPPLQDVMKKVGQRHRLLGLRRSLQERLAEAAEGSPAQRRAADDLLAVSAALAELDSGGETTEVGQ